MALAIFGAVFLFSALYRWTMAPVRFLPVNDLLGGLALLLVAYAWRPGERG